MAMSNFLVIEDSEADQFLFRDVVEEYVPGILILEARDGQEAVEMLDKMAELPQVIFLDINMPRMNGFEFLNVYDEKLYQNSVAVVMLTSSDQQKDIDKSRKYKSVKHYMEKPISTDFLDVLSREFN